MVNFLKKNSIIIILLLLFVILVFYYYFGIFNYNYLVPPGDDPTRHMTEAKEIIDEGIARSWAGSLDPPLFHILLALVSFFGGFNIVNTVLYIVPFIFIISYYAFYFTVKKLFNNNYLALLAMILLVFVSRQPRFAYTIGTYLTLFAGLALFVFGLAFLKNLFLSKKIDWRSIILCFLFFGGMMLTHSLSMTYMLLTIILIGIALLIFKLITRISLFSKYLSNYKQIYFKNFLILVVVMIIVVAPLTYDYYLNLVINKIESHYDALISASEAQVDLNGTINKAVAWKSYDNHLGFFIWSFSLITLPFFIFWYKNNLTKIIVLGWILALFIGSRSAFFILPERFALDMALPLIIVIACFFVYFCKYFAYKSNFIINLFLIFIIIANTYLFIMDGFDYRTKIRLQNSDRQAINWLKENTDKNSIILTYPKTLSMRSWGSYVGLLTERQIVDGSTCNDFKGYCPWIYDPTSEMAKNFYKENNIDYVYAGKKIMGGYNTKYKIDWNYRNYQSKLLETDFLEKKAEFFDSDELGKIIIFKVDKTKL